MLFKQVVACFRFFLQCTGLPKQFFGSAAVPAQTAAVAGERFFVAEAAAMNGAGALKRLR